jgi:hypothetical protein
MVFVERWDDYLFFESYMLFDTGFIAVKNVLLREEKAAVIAVINLKNDAIVADDALAIFLEQQTSPAEYTSLLKGDGSALNWMFLMDRYICASEKGGWRIYCEKENDVAVLALGADLMTTSGPQLQGLLKARSVKRADQNGNARQCFDFDRLVPEWKSALMREYAP